MTKNLLYNLHVSISYNITFTIFSTIMPRIIIAQVFVSLFSVFVSHKKKLTIAKYDGDESIEVKTLDVPRIIDALIFIDTQENKFPEWNASDSQKDTLEQK